MAHQIKLKPQKPENIPMVLRSYMCSYSTDAHSNGHIASATSSSTFVITEDTFFQDTCSCDLRRTCPRPQTELKFFIVGLGF